MKFRMIALLALFGLGTMAAPAMAQFSIELKEIGRYETGIFDESAAEIAAYDAKSKRLFVTNANDDTIDVICIRKPSDPTLLFSVDLTPYGSPNSVAFHRNTMAVAVENPVSKQDPGFVVFFDRDGKFVNQVTAGALPDMITVTPNGRYVLVANEGEPDDNYTVDPEGSVSIIDMRKGAKNLTQADVRTADFGKYNGAALDPSIRIFGPNATVAQDLEPEYIAVSADSRTAWVACQENNALARIDIRKAKVVSLTGFGFKDHTQTKNAFDASNKDNAINIAPWPTKGMYLPDAIASFRAFGFEYLITANEGDARDYDGYSEEERVKDVVLDPVAFPDAATLQLQENLGRLKMTTANGDPDKDGDFDEIYSFGARSFSIWNFKGKLVYDSGDDFEQITATDYPNDFNSTNDENQSFDNRSDDKGCEPEGVTVGRILYRTFAFIGLERMGGIMVYDVTNPYKPRFVQYVNTRDFQGDPAQGTAGDLGPEGLLYIPWYESPISNPLLVVTNEVSGSTTIFKIRLVKP